LPKKRGDVAPPVAGLCGDFEIGKHRVDDSAHQFGFVLEMVVDCHRIYVQRPGQSTHIELWRAIFIDQPPSHLRDLRPSEFSGCFSFAHLCSFVIFSINQLESSLDQFYDVEHANLCKKNFKVVSVRSTKITSYEDEIVPARRRNRLINHASPARKNEICDLLRQVLSISRLYEKTRFPDCTDDVQSSKRYLASVIPCFLEYIGDEGETGPRTTDSVSKKVLLEISRSIRALDEAFQAPPESDVSALTFSIADWVREQTRSRKPCEPEQTL